MITVTIDGNGDQIFLKGYGADIFAEVGAVKTQRASHVEPDAQVLRYFFHVIRKNCTDVSTLAAFTRHWPCLWRVNTAPVGGPILAGRWRNRKQAIAAEVEFLNTFFLEEKKIQ